MNRPARTAKQRQMMAEIFRSYENGVPISPGELLKQLTMKSGKSSLSCSLKFLEDKGLIARSYVGRRRVIFPTTLGYAWFKGSPV